MFYCATIFQHLFNPSNWNVILIVIALCSILAFAIFIERLIYLRQSEADSNQLLIRLRSVIEAGDLSGAIKICEETKGTVANVIKAGLLKHNRPKEHIEASMEVAGLSEIAKLERNAKILSVIAHVAPLIGLLGTVLGFIQAFSQMKLTGLMDISTTALGQALEYALITTAAGLVVAIPTVIAYNYIVSRIEAFVLEVQTTASEVVDLLAYRHEI